MALLDDLLDFADWKSKNIRIPATASSIELNEAGTISYTDIGKEGYLTLVFNSFDLNKPLELHGKNLTYDHNTNLKVIDTVNRLLEQGFKNLHSFLEGKSDFDKKMFLKELIKPDPAMDDEPLPDEIEEKYIGFLLNPKNSKNTFDKLVKFVLSIKDDPAFDYEDIKEEIKHDPDLTEEEREQELEKYSWWDTLEENGELVDALAGYIHQGLFKFVDMYDTLKQALDSIDVSEAEAVVNDVSKYFLDFPELINPNKIRQVLHGACKYV